MAFDGELIEQGPGSYKAPARTQCGAHLHTPRQWQELSGD